MNPNVELHIENLVLHGFDSARRQDIGEAVKAELTRLLSADGLGSSLANGRQLERLDGGSFDVLPNARQADVGSQIARALYGGLSK
jgi:hypothetical protein